MMTLRDYQREAVRSTLDALHRGCHPVISLPTGSGKALVLAALCQTLPGRLLQATHVKELVQQNAAELLRFDSSQEVGVYSAGLEQRDITQRIIIGGVQSIYTRMDVLQQAGQFQYILIDEAHRIAPRDAEAKMYNAVFAACPQAQRIGLSATPYRVDDGAIYGESGTYFDVLAHETGMRALVPEWLVPLRGITTAHDIDTTGVRTRQGDFVTSDLSQIACEEDLIEKTLDELCFLARKRLHWLLFCVDVLHVQMVTERLNRRGILAGMVTGETPSEERASTIAAFKRGDLRAVVNCNVLSTGFNYPDIDCVVTLRPTQSKSLFVQMLGRGSRQAEGKRDAAIIDFGGNLDRFIPLDAIHDYHKSPARQEKEAKKEAEAAQRRQLRHAEKASLLDPMAEDAPALTLPVEAVTYSLVPSKHPAQIGKTNLRVLYRLRHTLHKWVTGWVCVEYVGGARFHAARWFERRKVPMPSTASEALRRAKAGAYPMPEYVVVKQDGKYLRVIMEQFPE